MKLTIHVTPAHIRHGVAKMCIHCPVALAVNQAFANVADFEYSGASHGFIRLHFHKSPSELVAVPESVSLFMLNFDRFGASSVVPFSFEITIPESMVL